MYRILVTKQSCNSADSSNCCAQTPQFQLRKVTSSAASVVTSVIQAGYAVRSVAITVCLVCMLESKSCGASNIKHLYIT